MKMHEKCLLCGKDLEININNTYKESNKITNEMNIIKKIRDNVFECEIISHCFNCKHKSKFTKEIEFID